MLSWHYAVWIKGKQRVSGRWTYVWAGDYFIIKLDKREKYTGSPVEFKVYNEQPEWDGWKRLDKLRYE